MKTCKKVLALVLALCAMLSLLVPTAFASTETIDFYIGSQLESVRLGQVITVEKQGANYHYKDSAAYLTDSQTGSIFAQTDGKTLTVQNTKEDVWVAIELQSVKKGTYDIQFFNDRYSTSYIKNGAIFDVYVLPGVDYGTMGRKQIQQTINEQLQTAKKLPNSWDSSSNRDMQINGTKNGTVEFKADGNYVVVFKCKGVGVNNTVPTRMYLYLGAIKLKPSTEKANASVNTQIKKTPTPPTEATQILDITDISDQITSEVVLKDAIVSGTLSPCASFEFNGHDYFFGTGSGGYSMLYNVDTKQLVWEGNSEMNVTRAITLDGYGNLWWCGNKYYLFKLNLTTLEMEKIKISAGITGVTSFNATGLTWDPDTKKLYFGTYNVGTINMFDPLTYEQTNLAGVVDATPPGTPMDDGKAADSMYAGFGGLVVKDGYIYFGADGDINMDGIVSHHFVKFSIAERKIVDSVDLVAEGYWGTGGHYLGQVSSVGNVVIGGSSSQLKKTVAFDMNAEKLVPVDMGDMAKGNVGWISDAIDGKVYAFGNTKNNDGLFEIDVETLQVTAMNPVEFPRDMVRLMLQGTCLATVDGDERLPGVSLFTYQNNPYSGDVELLFYNIQTKERVIVPIQGKFGLGTRLTAVTSDPSGENIFIGGFGSNKLTTYEIATGNYKSFPTFSHQIDGLAWYNGTLYAGIYQSASIGQVNVDREMTKDLFDLQPSMFNMARVHALTGGDNKIFAGMVPDKYKIGGVLCWYDFDNELTYVAAGPNPEDVYYANTGIGGGDYVWRNVVTNKIMLNDLDGDGITDSVEIIDGVETQRFHGLIYHQTINCIVYKDGYIYGTTVIGGGSGSSTDPNTSAVIFVYDVENMKLVAELDLREVFYGYPDPIEFFDCIVEDPDIDGKFWAVTAGSLLSFTFDIETKTFNVTEEFVVNRREYKANGGWHPRSIVFDNEYMYLSLEGYGVVMLRRDNPQVGAYRLTDTAAVAEIVLGADNNLYVITNYDLVRINTYNVVKPYIDQSETERIQQLLNELPSEGITLEHEAQIDYVRSYYDSMSAEAKEMVDIQKLESAEDALALLKGAYVDEIITAIGTVSLESEAAISAARAAYEDLTDKEKACVTKLNLLVDAEAKLAALKNPNTTTKNPSDKTGEFPWIIVIVAVAIVAAGAVVAVILLKKRKPAGNEQKE